MEFLVIDFETAMKYDHSSICQAGLVHYKDGEITTLYDTLVYTDQEFTNTKIHGITADDVKDAPTFHKIYYELERLVERKIVFNHNNSDKTFFKAACELAGLPVFDVTWLNSATLVRRTWPEFASKGYGVEDMSKYLGIEYTPHNAASDAYATAKIIEAANKIKGFNEVVDWEIELSKQKKRIRNHTWPSDKQRIQGEITDAPDLEAVENKENPFFGKKVVISGKYETWPQRNDLAKKLKSLGADIDTSVGKFTNILCAGKDVGPKKIKIMTQKIERGEDARIINEEQIIELLKADL